MSRAQIVIDTKLQNALFREPKGQKTARNFFSPAKLRTMSFSVLSFSIRIGMCRFFCFSSKNIVSMAQEKQNTEGTKFLSLVQIL